MIHPTRFPFRVTFSILAKRLDKLVGNMLDQSELYLPYQYGEVLMTLGILVFCTMVLLLLSEEIMA